MPVLLLWSAVFNVVADLSVIIRMKGLDPVFLNIIVLSFLSEPDERTKRSRYATDDIPTPLVKGTTKYGRRIGLLETSAFITFASSVPIASQRQPDIP